MAFLHSYSRVTKNTFPPRVALESTLRRSVFPIPTSQVRETYPPQPKTLMASIRGDHRHQGSGVRKGVGCSKKQSQRVSSSNSNDPWIPGLQRVRALSFLLYHGIFIFVLEIPCLRSPNLLSVLVSMSLSHPFFPLGKLLPRLLLRLSFSLRKPCKKGQRRVMDTLKRINPSHTNNN